MNHPRFVGAGGTLIAIGDVRALSIAIDTADIPVDLDVAGLADVLDDLGGIKDLFDDIAGEFGLQLEDFGVEDFTDRGGLFGDGGIDGSGFRQDDFFGSIEEQLGMASDYGGYGSPGLVGSGFGTPNAYGQGATPTPIEGGETGDPFEFGPGAVGGGLIGLAVKGSASATITPADKSVSGSGGVVVSGSFDLSPIGKPVAASSSQAKADKAETKPARDPKPTEKKPGPIEEGVDSPKPKPGSGVGRPDPMREGGRPDAAAVRRIRREWEQPSYASDQPGAFGGHEMLGGRVVAIDWGLAIGGGVTDPNPYGDTTPWRPRKRLQGGRWKAPKPTSDGPGFGGSGVVAAVVGVEPARS